MIRDFATALQPGQQSKTLFQKKKERKEKEEKKKGKKEKERKKEERKKERNTLFMN